MPKELIAFSYDMIEDGEAVSKLKCLEGETVKLYGQFKRVTVELAESLITAREVLAGTNSEGKFKPWLETIGIPRTTAYRAIEFIENCEALSVPPRDTQIPQEGLKLLASPDCPREVVVKIKKADKQGQPIQVSKIKELIGESATEPEPEEEFEELTAEEHMHDVGRELERFAKSIIAIGKEPPECEWWTEQRVDGLQAHLRTAARTVRNLKPAGLCPLCNGDGCKPCKQSGWMPKVEFDSI